MLVSFINGFPLVYYGSLVLSLHSILPLIKQVWLSRIECPVQVFCMPRAFKRLKSLSESAVPIIPENCWLYAACWFSKHTDIEVLIKALHHLAMFLKGIRINVHDVPFSVHLAA